MTVLDAVTVKARSAAGIRGKIAIAGVVDTLLAERDSQDDRDSDSNSRAVRIGDDCAAIAQPDGWLLFAVEGLINEFVADSPWFAGYCGVMVNLSDIAAMGGRATAVVDALWSRDDERARPIVEGMAAAARAYQVPVVGGHSNTHSSHEQLSVAVLGHARQLLTSFDARPGDVLLAAVDLRGAYREPWPNWDASTTVHDSARLRADLDLLPGLAEDGLCRAAKDISMGGVVGTALMLAECSNIGLTLDVDAVPKPPAAEPARWLCETFPSYGFVLAVAPEHAATVIERFHHRGIACAAIGGCDDRRQVRLREGSAERTLYDFTRERYIGCRPRRGRGSPTTGSRTRPCHA